MSREIYLRLALTVAIAIIILVQAGIASPSAETGVSENNVGHGFKLPKLFQFEHYKELFRKRYSSLSEELIRRKIFLARAFRAFISGISFKFRKVNYFLSINPYSDRTKGELKRDESMVNPMAGFDEGHSIIDFNDVEDDKIENGPDSAPMIDERDVEIGIESVKKLASEKGEEDIVKELENVEALKRRRRSTETGKIRTDFSFDELIESPTKEDLPAEVKSRLDNNPAGNNPNYEPPEIESMGFEFPALNFDFVDLINNVLPFNDEKDETEEKEQEQRGSTSGKSQMNPVKSLQDLLDGASLKIAAWILPHIQQGAHVISEAPEGYVDESEDSDPDGSLPDKVFIDHGKSGCMFPAKSQAECGACYAFATTTYFEWLNCNSTGKLTRFSEQYLVDCGPDSKYNGSLHGCKGGLLKSAGLFYQDYGFEVGTRYPYVGKEGKCPYDTVNSTQMGFMRFEGTSDYAYIPLKLFSKYIKFAPILVGIGIGGDFREYGGGVHSGEKCCEGREDADTCAAHAVLIIGHGRQDGEDYWLIRNSHSANWGEKGNYKLSKKSDCIHPHNGVVFGTTDGINFSMAASRNKDQQVTAHARIKDPMRYKAQSARRPKNKGKNGRYRVQ